MIGEAEPTITRPKMHSTATRTASAVVVGDPGQAPRPRGPDRPRPRRGSGPGRTGAGRGWRCARRGAGRAGHASGVRVERSLIGVPSVAQAGAEVVEPAAGHVSFPTERKSP